MKILVAIHDVTPAHADAVQRLWSLCASRNVLPALFVVPNWHGEWPLERSERFVEWVRERANDGCDVFLQGERHDQVRADQARTRIAHGLERLRALEVEPVGFVAPAWLAYPECTRVVAGAWRAHLSAAVATARSWYHRDHWLVRLALHPQDLVHAATAGSIDATLDHWVARRLPWSYTAL